MYIEIVFPSLALALALALALCLLWCYVAILVCFGSLISKTSPKKMDDFAQNSGSFLTEKGFLSGTSLPRQI